MTWSALQRVEEPVISRMLEYAFIVMTGKTTDVTLIDGIHRSVSYTAGFLSLVKRIVDEDTLSEETRAIAG